MIHYLIFILAAATLSVTVYVHFRLPAPPTNLTSSFSVVKLKDIDMALKIRVNLKWIPSTNPMITKQILVINDGVYRPDVLLEPSANSYVFDTDEKKAITISVSCTNGTHESIGATKSVVTPAFADSIPDGPKGLTVSFEVVDI